MLISTGVMFKDQNTETINRTWKDAVSFKIIVTMSVTKPCFTTTPDCKSKIKTNFFGLFWFPVLS